LNRNAANEYVKRIQQGSATEFVQAPIVEGNVKSPSHGDGIEDMMIFE
jgi:hypothetical protein